MEAKNSSSNVSIIVQEAQYKQYFKNVANAFPTHKIMTLSKIPNQDSYLIKSLDGSNVLESSLLIVDENCNKKKVIFNKSSKNLLESGIVVKSENIHKQEISHEIVLNEQIKKLKSNDSNFEEVNLMDNEAQIVKAGDLSEIFNSVQFLQTNNVIIAHEIHNENTSRQNFDVTEDSHSNAAQKKNHTSEKLSNLLSCTGKQNVSEKESEKLQNSERFAKKLNLEKLNCFYCGKHFDKLFNLQQHERIHTGERPFQCIICGRAFSQKSNVIKHMSRHKVWPSPTLTINFKPNKKNHQSMKENLVELMSYSCQYCSLSFKSYPLLKKHLIVHSDIKVYRCIQKTCFETFKDLDEFLLHSKKHSTAEFICHICLKSFTNLGDLGEHQYEHNKNDSELTKLEKKRNSRRLKCKICCAQFKSIQSYQNHMAVDTHKYECVKCRNVFSSERALRRHLNLHIREQMSFESNDSQLKCQTCEKTFQSQKTLKSHELAHLSEKLFDCNQCHKQFSSKFRLQRHLSSHSNFECPYKDILGCDKTFLTKDNLKDHLHSHRLSRKCKICFKTFASFIKLNHHFKKEHLNEKNKISLRCKGRSQSSTKKQQQFNQLQCTEANKKLIKTKGKKETETVSNIEIIMVPYVSYMETQKVKT